jgi:hypothetical protein
LGELHIAPEQKNKSGNMEKTKEGEKGKTNKLTNKTRAFPQ